jgi:hypothetical protein
MASGHVNRIKRPNTWLHRPMLQNVKKAFANPARFRMTDRRSLMKILAGAALLGIARRASAQKTKSFTITYLALLPGEDRTMISM